MAMVSSWSSHWSSYRRHSVKKTILRDVLRIARENMEKHPEIDRGFLHWSFVVQSNKVIEWGTNHSGIPERHYGYEGRLKGLDMPPKTHAELAAFRKARGIMDLSKPWEIINIRLNKSGITKISAPCSCCAGWLESTECRTAWFSMEGDRWGKVGL